MIVRATRMGAILAFVLLACGTDATPQVSASGDAPAALGPLENFLGVSYEIGGPGDEKRQLFLESIQRCMVERGWEFQAVVEPAADQPDAPGGDDEWVGAYGFGITTQFFLQAQVGPELLGVSVAPSAPPLEFGNDAYVAGLSEAEREIYLFDLRGPLPAAVPESSERRDGTVNVQPGGCERQANANVYGDRERVFAFLDEFGAELENLTERTRSDERVVKAFSALTTCMLEKGQPFDPAGDITAEVYRHFEPQLLDLRHDLADNLSTLSASQRASLGQMQRQELQIARDLLACEPGFFLGNGTTAAIYRSVLTEYQQNFVTDNQEILQEFTESGPP